MNGTQFFFLFDSFECYSIVSLSIENAINIIIAIIVFILFE